MSYLCERSQIVQIESKLSKEIKGGNFSIPQGSILGSLIHVVNCNDLPACHEEDCESDVYFDDDTDIATAADGDRIQEEAARLAE